MNREDQFIPHLIVNDGMAALKFYQEVFGAEEGHNMMAPDGKRLMHGELVLNGHKFFVSDEFRPEEGGACKTPQTLGDLLEGIVLHAFDGRHPFSAETRQRITELKRIYKLDLDSSASHRLMERVEETQPPTKSKGSRRKSK